MNTYAKQLIASLQAMQDAQKAKWLENYVKHNVKSYGVGIPKIREMVQLLEKDNQISGKGLTEQTAFLNDLMSDIYTESKLAAIVFIQLYWKTDKAAEILELSSYWFDNQWITDWNICDWLCVRLLSSLIDECPDLAIPVFAQWNQSANLWQARASLVPFAQCKSLSGYVKIIIRFSEVLINREERFCKTAVGWVLREYSKIDHWVVTDFLEQYKNYTSKEVVANATKYLKYLKS